MASMMPHTSSPSGTGSSIGSTPSRPTTGRCAGCGVVAVVGVDGGGCFDCLCSGVATAEAGHEGWFAFAGDGLAVVASGEHFDSCLVDITFLR